MARGAAAAAGRGVRARGGGSAVPGRPARQWRIALATTVARVARTSARPTAHLARGAP